MGPSSDHMRPLRHDAVAVGRSQRKSFQVWKITHISTLRNITCIASASLSAMAASSSRMEGDLLASDAVHLQ